ncbi:hypothetical protein ZIOFF_065842 [Zingiber officinale]|uniref:Reverse transcriptase Ty1/copia-type domain-containing protein n=1 Tax=Zingiber officinale TaxID=94328 RepID=A0A8J5KHE7_ZINOF|nr:hypothetical protein ZIOFF_065842 [Zingiber officinale]
MRSAEFSDHVCRLHKVLYGLKQAPRAWYLELCAFLVSFGFVVSRVDTSLFVYFRDGNLIYFLVYIDDLIITGSDASSVDVIVCNLHAKFAIKELGALSLFCGVELVYAADASASMEQLPSGCVTTGIGETAMKKESNVDLAAEETNLPASLVPATMYDRIARLLPLMRPTCTPLWLALALLRDALSTASTALAAMGGSYFSMIMARPLLQPNHLTTGAIVMRLMKASHDVDRSCFYSASIFY